MVSVAFVIAAILCAAFGGAEWATITLGALAAVATVVELAG